MKVASAAPSDQVVVQGGWQGGRATVKRAYYGIFPYKKKDGTSNPSAALILELSRLDTREGSPTKGQLTIETIPFSMGKMKPCDQKGNPVPQGMYAGSDELDGFPDNCNAALLFGHLVSAGFDEGKLKTSPISVLDGLDATWKQVAQPDRDFGETPKEGQKKKVKMLTVPAEIHGQKAAGKGNGAVAKDESEDTPDEETLLAILSAVIAGIIEKRGGKAKKVAVTLELPKALEGGEYAEHKEAVMALYNRLSKSEFEGEGFAFDGKEFAASA